METLVTLYIVIYLITKEPGLITEKLSRREYLVGGELLTKNGVTVVLSSTGSHYNITVWGKPKLVRIGVFKVKVNCGTLKDSLLANF